MTLPSRRWVLAPYLDLPIADDGDEVDRSARRTRCQHGFSRGGPAAGRILSTNGSGRVRQAMRKRPRCRSGCAGLATISAMPRERWSITKSIAARADRERFIRIARERGYCRMLHEHHSTFEVLTKVAIANVRISVCATAARLDVRLAREERRLAIARGMHDGLRRPSSSGAPSTVIPMADPD